MRRAADRRHNLLAAVMVIVGLLVIGGGVLRVAADERQIARDERATVHNRLTVTDEICGSINDLIVSLDRPRPLPVEAVVGRQHFRATIVFTQHGHPQLLDCRRLLGQIARAR